MSYEMFRDQYKEQYNEDCTLKDEILDNLFACYHVESPLEMVWAWQHEKLQIHDENNLPILLDPIKLDQVDWVKSISDWLSEGTPENLSLDGNILVVRAIKDGIEFILKYDLNAIKTFRYKDTLLLENFQRDLQ